MLVIPASISYFAGWDTQIDYLFFLRAFAIAFCSTVVYYLLEKRRRAKK